MRVTEEAAAWARAMAADDTHGYDQTSRWGPDYDCSSLTISAFKKAGVPLTCTYTGNMRADMLCHGFKDVTGQINLKTGKGLKKGDVLLHEAKHTALYIGDGQIVNAGGNEYGRATGGKTGDQTGRELAICAYYNFPWEYVLRYEGNGRSDEGIAPYADGEDGRSDEGVAPYADGEGEYTLYTVKQGDSFWAIAERELGDGTRYAELAAFNGMAPKTVIHPGQVLKLPGKGGEERSDEGIAPYADGEDGRSDEGIAPYGEDEENAGGVSVTVTLDKSLAEKMKKAAEDRGITLAELITEAFQ